MADKKTETTKKKNKRARKGSISGQMYTIAILPLAIGMTIANALNIYMSKKTHSIWPGLFTALLWGSWMIISCGGMTKYLY